MSTHKAKKDPSTESRPPARERERALRKAYIERLNMGWKGIGAGPGQPSLGYREKDSK